jgi:hypothetical protein
MFTKGQRVVCINDTFDSITRIAFQNLPVKGTIYTVRALYVGRGKLLPGSPGEADGEIGVLLEEIRNQDLEARFSKHGFEPGFSSERFAPAQAAAESEELVEHEPATAGA